MQRKRPKKLRSDALGGVVCRTKLERTLVLRIKAVETMDELISWDSVDPKARRILRSNLCLWQISDNHNFHCRPSIVVITGLWQSDEFVAVLVNSALSKQTFRFPNRCSPVFVHKKADRVVCCSQGYVEGCLSDRITMLDGNSGG